MNGSRIFGSIAAVSAYAAITVLNYSESQTAKNIAYALFVIAVLSLILMVFFTIHKSIRAQLNNDDKAKKTSESVPFKEKTIDIKQKNTMRKTDFVAIDFEHLYSSHETACEVGAVRVVDGLVTSRFYSTIKPPIEKCSGRDNSDIIGLTKDMLIDSPEFPEVYRQLCLFVGKLPLVAHHASTEKNVLEKCCTLYKIEETLLRNGMTDTCTLSGGAGLSDCCMKYDIPLDEHHHPLQDAEATAKLYLALIGEGEKTVIRGERIKTSALNRYKKEQENFDPTILQPLDDYEVVNKDTPFFGRVKTVVSGQFEAYPDRNALKASLKGLGADIDGNISKNTRLFVVGKTGVGPSKMEKALKYGTRIIQEEELYQWVEKQV